MDLAPNQPPIRLRPAAEPDQAAIRQLIGRNGLNPLGLAWPNFVVAVEPATGRFLGCGQIKPHGDGSNELASLAVVDDYQGQGLGAAIIRHLQQMADPPLWLMCGSRLVPYYERFDFRWQREPAGLPPYFRRMAWLARPFNWLTRRRHGDQLAIMAWSPGHDFRERESR